MENKGVIYILTNPSFPQYVKIGYADNVEQRLEQLNRSECIPFAFRLYAYYGVPQRLTDLKLHEMIDSINPELRTIDNFNGKKRIREFYAMSPEAAFNILDTIATISGSRDKLVLVNPSIDQALDDDTAVEIRKPKKESNILPRMDWLMEQGIINVGDQVYITKAPEEIAEVLDSKYVRYNNQVMTFNEFGLTITGWTSIQIYAWMKIVGFDKTLDELRTERIVEITGKPINSQIGTEEITKYIIDLIDNARKKGEKYIDIKSLTVHKKLKLVNRMPMVCNAMRKAKQILGIDAEVIVDVPKHNSSTYTIRYKF